MSPSTQPQFSQAITLTEGTPKILGLDPGLGIVGFGVIGGDTNSPPQWGTITTPKNTPVEHRLVALYQDMQTLLATVQPDVVAIEKIFHFRNVTTMVPVTQARGVMVLAVAQAGLPIAEYTPMQIKQTVTGYGKAEKTEVQAMVTTLLDLESIPRPDDAADGLAIALCHQSFMR